MNAILFSFARGRPTNPARIPIGHSADWYYIWY